MEKNNLKIDYVYLAERTKKDPRIVLGELDTTKVDLMHSAIGVASEYGEFFETTIPTVANRDEWIKEAGDILWYLAIPYQLYPSLHFPDAFNPTLDTGNDNRYYMDVFMPSMENYCSLIKAHVFYNRELDIMELHKDVCVMVNCISNLLKGCIEEAMEKNIAKLKARYPSAFSDGDANAKGDESIEKRKLAQVILKATFPNGIPANIDVMEQWIKHHPLVYFPEDIKEEIIEEIGYDVSNIINFEGSVADSQHQM